MLTLYYYTYQQHQHSTYYVTTVESTSLTAATVDLVVVAVMPVDLLVLT
jgi:hypothetical protein